MRVIWLCGLGLAILTLGAGRPATPYLPPLASSPGLSSGFGEFRSGHFHAGLDYSTEQVEGKPVRAVADGWVERVRASGIGYGRSIYLRLADGHTAVYGHLSRFAPKLDAYVGARQESSGVYEQDLWPAARAIPFRRGDVIAWSGQSGAGPPHLHFELRQGDTNFNPLRHGFGLPDGTPPTLAAAWLTPRGPRARVGGGMRAVRIVLRPGGVVSAPPVRGPFDLALDTWDRASGRPNKLATYRLDARLDDRAAFEAVLDSISWDDAVEVERVYDYAATLHGIDTRRPLALLPTYHSGVIRRGPPVWSLAPGVHRFEFVAIDEAGNRSLARLEVPVLEADSASASVDSGADTAAGGTRCGEGGASCTVSAREGPLRLTLTLRGASLFEPARLTQHRVEAAGGDELTPLGPAIEIGPTDLVLRSSFKISGAYDLESAPQPGPLGLFTRQSEGWSFVSRLDSTGAFAGASRRLGAFGVFADRVPPTIVPPARYRWRAGSASPAFGAVVRDRGAGLSGDDQTMYLDERRVPAEYDPEASRLTWRPRARPAPGHHVVRIAAVDQLGNRAVATVPLEVE